MECKRCGRETARPIKHHVSYDPEVVILVCRKCHGELHGKDYSKGIRKINKLKHEGLKNRLKNWFG